MATANVEVVVEVRTLPAGRLKALEELEQAVRLFLARSAADTSSARHELHGAYVAAREAM